jgi:hypothetical protein
MSQFNESKRAIWVKTGTRALPPLIHYFIGFRVFKALWCGTGDNYLIVLIQKSLILISHNFHTWSTRDITHFLQG